MTKGPFSSHHSSSPPPPHHLPILGYLGSDWRRRSWYRYQGRFYGDQLRHGQIDRGLHPQNRTYWTCRKDRCRRLVPNKRGLCSLLRFEASRVCESRFHAAGGTGKTSGRPGETRHHRTKEEEGRNDICMRDYLGPFIVVEGGKERVSWKRTSA